MAEEDNSDVRDDEPDSVNAESQNDASDATASTGDSTSAGGSENGTENSEVSSSESASEQAAEVAASDDSEASEGTNNNSEGDDESVAAGVTADSSPSPAGSAGSGPDIAEEESIRAELGIGGGKIEIDQEAVDKLLNEAIVGYEQVFAEAELEAETEAPVSSESSGSSGDMVAQNLGLLRDVNMRVKVELGRGRMYLKDILRLAQGSVVELERLAGDPLEIYVNEKVVARGEVLVLNENFCIRITEIYSPAEILSGVA